MFLAVDRTELALMPLLCHSMFSDRASQFVARHGWALDLDAAGLEVDEYDDTLATYCIIEGEHRHRASVRLRTAATGSMVEHHFPELWRTDLSERVEITRFCAAPDLGLEDRLTAVADLLLGLCRHCQRTGIRSIFGVVFPAVARVIRQAGWAGEVLAQQEFNRRHPPARRVGAVQPRRLEDPGKSRGPRERARRAPPRRGNAAGRLIGRARSAPPYICRSTISFLISAIAFAGFRCFGQVCAQFMMVWQR